MTATNNNENYNRMVARAFEILDLLSESDVPLGVSELSTLMNLSKSTTYRILYTLTDFGVLIQQEDGKYQLGHRLVYYGAQVRLKQDLISVISPIMEQLVQETGETVNFGIHQDNLLVMIKSVNGEENLWTERLVPVTPLHCSSGGKLILANQDIATVKEYFQHDVEQRTIYTITDYDQMCEELTEIRQQGYAIDDEEYEYGLKCIAYPVYRQDGSFVGSLSLSGPASRIHHKGIDELHQVINHYRHRIEDAIQRYQL